MLHPLQGALNGTQVVVIAVGYRHERGHALVQAVEDRRAVRRVLEP